MSEIETQEIDLNETVSFTMDGGFNLPNSQHNNIEREIDDELKEEELAERETSKQETSTPYEFQSIEEVIASSPIDSQHWKELYSSKDSGDQSRLSKPEKGHDWKYTNSEGKIVSLTKEILSSGNAEAIAQHESILLSLYENGYAISKAYYNPQLESMVRDFYFTDEKGHISFSGYVEEKTKSLVEEIEDTGIGPQEGSDQMTDVSLEYQNEGEIVIALWDRNAEAMAIEYEEIDSITDEDRSKEEVTPQLAATDSLIIGRESLISPLLIDEGTEGLDIEASIDSRSENFTEAAVGSFTEEVVLKPNEDYGITLVREPLIEEGFLISEDPLVKVGRLEQQDSLSSLSSPGIEEESFKQPPPLSVVNTESLPEPVNLPEAVYIVEEPVGIELAFLPNDTLNHTPIEVPSINSFSTAEITAVKTELTAVTETTDKITLEIDASDTHAIEMDQNTVIGITAVANESAVTKNTETVALAKEVATIEAKTNTSTEESNDNGEATTLQIEEAPELAEDFIEDIATMIQEEVEMSELTTADLEISQDIFPEAYIEQPPISLAETSQIQSDTPSITINREAIQPEIVTIVAENLPQSEAPILEEAIVVEQAGPTEQQEAFIDQSSIEAEIGRPIAEPVTETRQVEQSADGRSAITLTIEDSARTEQAAAIIKDTGTAATLPSINREALTRPNVGNNVNGFIEQEENTEQLGPAVTIVPQLELAA